MKKTRDVFKNKQENHSLGWEDLLSLNVNPPKMNTQVMRNRALSYTVGGKKRFPSICGKQSHNIC